MEPAPARSNSALARDSWITRGANHFGMPRREFIAAASLFVVMIAFKIVNMMCFRFDSDEPQHLHVIWAWARGFVQYRDVFDNHMPLFQIMFAPIFGLIGDRPTILYWMRFILLPMYFVAAWCTYRIGTLLFSRRVGAWAVLLAGGSTSYHFISFEFRTDNLWAPLWLLCIAVLLGGAMNVRRAMVAGLLFGFCFGISMKSSLLLLSIFVATVIALLLVGREQLGKSWAHLIRCAATFLGTTLLVPATIMIFFALKGVWRDFRYCVFDHNFLPHLDAKNSPAWWIVVFPIAFPLVVYIARRIVRATPDPALGFRRAFIFVICGFYITALYSFWTLMTRQDYLPYHPLAFVFFAAAVLAICDSEKFRSWLPPRLRRVSWPVWLTVLGLLVSLVTRPFWINGAKAETELLRDVLRLTEPGDFVFDCKGETIFRQRCFRPILEPVTFERIQRRMIPDDVAQRCVETRTCLVAPTGSTPWYARQFISKNYLPVKGFVRVAGGYLTESTTQSGALEFESVIPAPYKLVVREGNVEGLLDGEAYRDARFLNPGKHLFAPSNKTGPVAFVWARAIDLHYSPFDYVPPKSREK
jgi:Dolichyl-phosphate-mannose-protein mannosyltransferase